MFCFFSNFQCLSLSMSTCPCPSCTSHHFLISDLYSFISMLLLSFPLLYYHLSPSPLRPILISYTFNPKRYSTLIMPPLLFAIHCIPYNPIFLTFTFLLLTFPLSNLPAPLFLPPPVFLLPPSPLIHLLYSKDTS